jgi:hypothetical protein
MTSAKGIPMASALIVPGVQVKTEFEPAPVLPGATGILGLVGVTDRGPLNPTRVGSFGELISLFGPATRFSMPEARTAFVNGVMEIVVARTAPGGGEKAKLTLKDDDGDDVAILETRAEGNWANRLAARVTQVRTLGGTGLKYVNLEILLNGERVEALNNLIMDPTKPNYLFNQINMQSRLVVAYDPLFQKDLPPATAQKPLALEDARAASVILQDESSNDVVKVIAKDAGPAGNLSSVRVREGHYGLGLGPDSVDISAKVEGEDGKDIKVSVANIGATFTVTISVPGKTRPALPAFSSVAALLTQLKNDPDVTVKKLGTGQSPPADILNGPLKRRVTIDVVTEGGETRTYADLADLDAIVAIDDQVVAFSKATLVANALPATNPGGVPLESGRAKGPALPLKSAAGKDMLEIQPAPGAAGSIAIKIEQGVSSADGATPVATLSVFLDGVLTETFTDLTMDPDDPNYLPAVLRESAVIRGFDLFVRNKSTSLPTHMIKAQPFAGGTSPSVDDYQDALDRLESAEEVDLVIASVANQLNEAGVRAVHQAVAAHCTKMADPARNRIGLGSVTAAATAKRETRVANILDHADSVRSDAFILATPAGSEAAVAGLLSLQDYFQSPTFKTVPALGVPPGQYTDSELNQLVAGNVAVIQQKRKRGIIVVKGLLTSGRQINVQRTANKAVRDVKAIADVYIGLLNNEGNRNALRQQIIAMFLQMTRDGALVPSTDGKDPPFKVEVYSTQADFANGIVRIDVAVRPVRAIDYIYATILVQN